jgi:predicted transcriptional regulator
MHPVLGEIYKLHGQSTIGGAAIMCLRGRVEAQKAIHNRIGGDFQNPRSLLIFGKAGTGKTRFLKQIFYGFGLDGLKADGDIVGKFHDSAGCSTTVGIASLLETYGDCIHVFDEMSFNTSGHIHLLKQIANGRIVRQRHRNTEPFAFNGLIIGATNGIKPPPVNEIEDMLATLDRFIIVEARPAKYGPVEYFDAVIDYHSENPDINFNLLEEALNNDNFKELNKQELAFAKKLWKQKSCEILDDGERAQFRNVRSVIDIVTFVKRIINTDDMTKFNEAKSFAKAMVRDTICFNPAPLLALSAAQKAVYNVIVTKRGSATLQDMATRCKAIHGAGNIHRVINQLMSMGLIYRTRHGHYSHLITEKEASVTKSNKKEINKQKNTERSLVEFL